MLNSEDDEDAEKEEWRLEPEELDDDARCEEALVYPAVGTHGTCGGEIETLFDERLLTDGEGEAEACPHPLDFIVNGLVYEFACSQVRQVRARSVRRSRRVEDDSRVVLDRRPGTGHRLWRWLVRTISRNRCDASIRVFARHRDFARRESPGNIMARPPEKLEGQQFNYLTALEYTGHSKWRCLCTRCGNETVVLTNELKRVSHQELWLLGTK